MMDFLIYAILVVILLKLIDSSLPLEIVKIALGLFFCVIVIFVMFLAIATVSPFFLLFLLILPFALINS